MNTSAGPECGAESGEQLLSRLETRPNLIGLDPVLFESGPFPNDITEISGDVSAGKTLLVTQLLAKCLLPKMFGGAFIGGLNAGAVLIDTDQHFQILKLMNIMEEYVSRSCVNTNSSSEKVDATAVENLIHDALDNLTILRCYDSAQLIITFHGLEKILSSNKNISLLVLDNISAFYWQNTLNTNGIRKMDTYLKKILISLLRHIQQFKVSVIYTKPSYFQSKIQDASDSSITNIRGRTLRLIYLQKVLSDTDLFCAHISSNLGRKVITYEIGDNGIKWHTSSLKLS